jgi:hypothetical protein
VPQTAAQHAGSLFMQHAAPGLTHAYYDPINYLYGAATGRGDPLLDASSLDAWVQQPSQEKTFGGAVERVAAESGRGFGTGVAYGAPIGMAAGSFLGPGGTAVGAVGGGLAGGVRGAVAGAGAQALKEAFPDTPGLAEVGGTILATLNPRQIFHAASELTPRLGAAYFGLQEGGALGVAAGWLGAHGVMSFIDKLTGASPRMALTAQRMAQAAVKPTIGFEAGQQVANYPPGAQPPPVTAVPSPASGPGALTPNSLSPGAREPGVPGVPTVAGAPFLSPGL